MTQKIVYIYSESLVKELDKIQIIKHRNRMVHSLINSYRLLDKLTICVPREASEHELNYFHSSDYISYLKSLPTISDKNYDQARLSMSDSDDFDESTDSISDDDLEYGIGYDCPKFNNMFGFVTKIAGSTLSAAEAINDGKADIVINWFGGWHHAQRDSASGFCYVNDVSVGIMKLTEKYSRIMYVDLDVHHGDGVENAFHCTKRVLTLSFHIHQPGFFPSQSGSHLDCGFGNGKGFAINAPYKYNIGEKFPEYFHAIFNLACEHFKPEVYVIQCGADVLSGDPLGGANLLIQDMEKCVSEILSKPGPKLFLGGGGYNPINASKYWTCLTALILGIQLDEDIPEHKYFEKYGPCFTNQIERKHLKNMNDPQELIEIINHIKANLEKYVQTPAKPEVTR